MINTQRLIKVSAAWATSIYIVSVAVFSFMPFMHPMGMMWRSWNMPMNFGIASFGAFLSGLIAWNIAVIVAVWLFAVLWNAIKK